MCFNCWTRHHCQNEQEGIITYPQDTEEDQVSIIEGSFIQTDEKYSNGVAIDDYKGNIKIVRAYKDKNGDIKAKWGFPEKDKRPLEKSIPWGIDLGSRYEAAGTLAALLEILAPKATGNKMQAQKPEEDDIPF
jgi:hypothetical protein